MSLRDDFAEAWRSVKRDLFQDNAAGTDNPTPKQDDSEAAHTHGKDNQDRGNIPYSSAAATASITMNAFEQASALDDDGMGEDYTMDDEIYTAPGATYRTLGSGITSDDTSAIFNEGIYNTDRTIISKNTVIRGALQTDDSVQVLGEVMGDIDCKSNIVIAGKVQGNTNASNAYVYNAQIDGDLRCEDILCINNDAWILGNVRAQQAEVDGKIKGNLDIRNHISIGATSAILGDISADELEIKRGAFVNGQIMMYSPSREVLDQFDKIASE